LILASLSDRLPVLGAFKELLRKRPGVPLALALALSLLLFAFGSGPAGSDAKVNLGPLQPVEFIKILIVFYLAAYFDRHWEFLRFLKQKGTGVFALLNRLNAPRLVFFLPVMIAMGAALLFFFLQKDLGPALILGSTFLSLYAVARKHYALIVGGLLMLAAGLLGAYQLGQPATVVKRIDIFRDVWENSLRGGDQIAHSLWAMSTGGATGTGLGLGDPGIIPAGHTDLILSSIGEELGFAGFAAVLALYAFLIARSIRAAMQAPSDYQLFLALGLTLITAWQILLITTGILGLFPLSGVVSPFLSWGKSSMIANFVIVGLILAVSSTSAGNASGPEPFRAPVKWLGLVLAALGLLVVGAAANYQLLRADETALRGALVELRDKSHQFQYNRRLTDVARKLKLGTIRDRNGVPLAASDCQELIAHRAALEGLGVSLDKLCQLPPPRIYPFGSVLFHLLGDLNTQRNWAARNTNYVERDYAGWLRGYDDHAVAVKIEDVLNRRAIAAAERQRRQTAPPAIETDPDVEPDAGEDSSAEESESRGGAEEEEIDEGAAVEPQRYVIRRDLGELLPLLRHRYEPDHPAVQALLTKERDLQLSIDIRLQLKASELLAAKLKGAAVKRGAAVVLDPATGDVLAAVSYPWPGMPVTKEAVPPGEPAPPPDELVDRAFTALRPPGSTFKIVTAMAALNRAEADYRQQRFGCEPLGDGRVGKRIAGFNRPVRDSEGDRAHGSPDLEAAIVDSCNAYFAQLGVRLGAADVKAMADRCGIRAAASVEELREGENLPQGAYGQGRVVATPFQMARVAATVANDGRMPQGRWVAGDGNRRVDAPASIVSPEGARFLLGAMRGVVARGTARRFAASAMAGKTGTAQVMKRVRISENGKPGFRDKSGKLVYLDANPDELRPAYRFVKQTSHGWFIGLAPFAAPRRIAFSVLIENGGYGGATAAPVANEIVAEAMRLGLIP
jgi:cell division protein FtsW (lipid II flippase)